MKNNILQSLTILLSLNLFLTTTLPAQNREPLPVDPQVRYGVLENGLTYYVRHNALPKGQADFYIAQKVGSVLEEEGQEGLAHFLEHMAFNGTEHFPGKTMLEYLESIGVKFGTNINAYTSFDQTVYNIDNVPVPRQGIIDSCLLVLHDWACAIALEEGEIDNERGVIREEWRTRSTSGYRIMEQLLPVMFAGSRYADRMPIGKMEVVDNFAYDTLRAYYHRWYRPDQQGIVVVGDIDAQAVEQKILELFSPIMMPDNAEPRIYFEVPDNREPVVAIATDKEFGNAQLTVYYKHDILPPDVKAAETGLMLGFMKSSIVRMLNARLDEISNKPGSPFIGAMSSYGQFYSAKTKDAFTVINASGENDIIKAMAAMLREVERVDKYGFTQSEYERAKATFLMGVESLYNERDKHRSSRYRSQYVSHFLGGGSISGFEYEYELYNRLIPRITLERINEYARSLIREDNVVISLMAPDKEGVAIPTKEELIAVFGNVNNEELEPYVDSASGEPLVPQPPIPGKIISESRDTAFGAEVWRLSNGAKVVVKPTDFKADEITMAGSSPGGNSLFPQEDAVNIKVLNSVVELGGMGNFSAIDLPKALAGKKVSFISRVLDRSEYVKGSSSPKELKTLMELTYLSFTAPRRDDEALESWKERYLASILNDDNQPSTIYQDSIVSTVYSNNPRTTRLRKEDLQRIDYDAILNMYNDRFKDGSDFVFVFVGNIDKEELKPLVEQYIASLPTINRNETSGNPGIDITKGKVINHFRQEMETPKTSVQIWYSGDCSHSLENGVKMTFLTQIMNSVFMESLREEEGGTYGAGVTGSIDRYDNEYVFRISFDTNAGLKEKLISIVHREIERMAEEGPKEADFNKVREYLLKSYVQNLKENSYWLNMIDSYYLDGVDLLNGYDTVVKDQTPETIREFAAQLFSQGNEIEVVMDGM